MEQKIKPEASLLFELSWEVCNKVGGIYTVITSKASQMVDYYQDGYFLVGPYFPDKAKGQFEEKDPSNDFKAVFDKLEKQGIKCHLGKWLIQGEPQTILIDCSGFYNQAEEIKKRLWKSYQIDSLGAGDDFNHPLVWSWAAGKLIEETAKLLKRKKIASHFHEWLGAAGLLYLKMNKVKTGIVFTTHATVLGRAMANQNLPLYSLLEKVVPDEEARRHNAAAKHLLEKNAAQQSHVFTTVSEITAIEAKSFLGREPDLLTFNGLDMENYPTFEENLIKHRIQKSRIREFVSYYFLPYYPLDFKNTLFYFISGRYEFHNKGIDIFIKGLGKLNQQMKKDQSSKNIVAFIWVPANSGEINPKVLRAREIYQDIKDYFEEVSEEVERKVLYSLAAEKNISEEKLFSRSFLREIKKKVMKLKQEGLPPISSHYLVDDNDEVIKAIKEAGLENRQEDKVKVIFYPIYLKGDDGLLNLNYHESIQGTHLGVFPSFYEPWGYTPLETAGLGVSAATTDLAGFGRFLKDKFENKEQPGIFVLERHSRQDIEKIADDLAKIFYKFLDFSVRQRVDSKIKAYRLAGQADWKILVKKYLEAQNKALQKI